MSGTARTHARCRRAAALSLADVLNAPELAVLDVLAHAANLAKMALLAQHPHLLGDESGRVCIDDDTIAQAAAQVIDRAVDLSTALQRYRRAIANAATRPDDDFPF